jgi:predicted solute-binding protein
MLHGDQRDQFDLSFTLPSECADRLESAAADIGIVPAVELPRLDLEVIRGAGIASRGAVRSIQLISRRPFDEIRTLAADAGSRTSVALARILLAERHGATPRVVSMPPNLDRMLEAADAALIIGDPALHLNPASLPHETRDLGEEWTRVTGLPMVFAVWAGRPGTGCKTLEPEFLASCRFGLADLDRIIREEAPRRGLPERLVREYLTRRIHFELGENEYSGLELFLEMARKLDQAGVAV